MLRAATCLLIQLVISSPYQLQAQSPIWESPTPSHELSFGSPTPEFPASHDVRYPGSLEPAWRPRRIPESLRYSASSSLASEQLPPHWTLPAQAPQTHSQITMETMPEASLSTLRQRETPESTSHDSAPTTSLSSPHNLLDLPTTLFHPSSSLSSIGESWPPVPSSSWRDTWDRERSWLFGQSVIPGSFSSPRTADPSRYWWDAVGRAYYMNDHRMEFTGQEATFGVEGIVRGGLTRTTPEWLIHAGGELYVTQPFDNNILVDAPERSAFAPNFDVEVLEISQMVLAAERGDWSVGLGKFVTPFGRTYYPIFTNSRWETPFIRAESIQYRETGMYLSYSPGPWSIDAALTNGGWERDTNSSKALVSRIGWQSDRLIVGGSVKTQDGIGSEGQKHYNHHIGMDAALELGRWTLSSEVIIDYYGYRRDGFAPGGITWSRSLYHRDFSKPFGGVMTGWGYYGGLRRDGELWTTWLSYGEFYPEQIGDRIQDTPTRRFLVKGVRSLGAGVDWYGALMFETTIENAFAGKDRIGSSLLTGFQIGL